MAISKVSFLLVSLLALFASISASESTDSSASSDAKEFVLTLDHTNFSETVAKHDFIVVEFYAPWCGHCKSLAPEYEKAASLLSSHDPPIVLAKVDANEDSNKELASEYDVKGYPTLKIVRNGGKYIQEYKGPREAEGIVEYLKKQSGPASVEIKSADDATTLIGDQKVVIVGIFPELSGEEYTSFQALAEKLRSDYEFGHTTDAKLLPRGESSVKKPTLRLFKPFDELVVDSQDFNAEALEKFVEESSTPTVTIFSKDPAHHPYVIKFFNSPNAKALLNCGFFQRSCGLKMHDVMHDAVVMLAGHKYKMVDSNTVEFDERVHHVSVGNVVDSSWDVLSSLSKIKYLESFLVVSRETNLTARNWFIYHKVMLSRFQCLKILDLHGIWIKKLPKSLGELICLRHLDLSETAIVKLPNSVVQLVNLLSLQLYSCINLQELPKDMSNLVKLRHLQLSECSELIHMPKGLGKLTNLQTLSVFVVREKSSRSKFEANDVGGLEDLKHLNHLKGELSIQVCKQPKDIVLGARMANLRRKEKLIDLSIDFRDSTKEDEAVLEGLQPHANLRYLKIQGYGGERLPSWMINDNLHCRLPNLIQIKILNCKSCRYLCHLGRLPYLKVLFLEGLDNVEYIEKYTSSSSNSANDKGSTPESLFPSLDTFRLKGIPKLKGWWNMSSIGDHDLRQHHDFQYQNHLTVWRPAFPKLKALTTDSIELAITIAKGPGFASLEHLYIKHNSRASLPLCQQQTPTPLNTCFPNLRCLQLSGNPEIEALPDEIQDLFYLEYLRIDNCKQLKAIPEWIDSLRSLTSLYIWECPRLESLPHQISNLSNLRLLGISKCSAVLTEKCLCKNPTGEYWPYIQHIPYINIRLSNQNPTGEYWPYI